jgi:hypothetical protein
MKYPICTAIILFFASHLSAQELKRDWHYGIEIVPVSSQQFDFSRGAIGRSESIIRSHIWGEYRFKGREKGPFLIQNGLRMDIMSFNRNTIINGREEFAGFYRIPLTWTVHQPRFFRDERFPLFEMSSGIGPHVNLPLTFGGADGDTYLAPSLGFHGTLGIGFYIQAGTRITLNYQTTTDLFALRKREGFTRNRALFMENGFSIGFASSVSDTRTRSKALRAARKKRKR